MDRHRGDAIRHARKSEPEVGDDGLGVCGSARPAFLQAQRIVVHAGRNAVRVDHWCDLSDYLNERSHGQTLTRGQQVCERAQPEHRDVAAHAGHLAVEGSKGCLRCRRGQRVPFNLGIRVNKTATEPRAAALIAYICNKVDLVAEQAPIVGPPPGLEVYESFGRRAFMNGERKAVLVDNRSCVPLMIGLLGEPPSREQGRLSTAAGVHTGNGASPQV